MPGKMPCPAQSVPPRNSQSAMYNTANGKGIGRRLGIRQGIDLTDGQERGIEEPQDKVNHFGVTSLAMALGGRENARRVPEAAEQFKKTTLCKLPFTQRYVLIG